MNIKDFKNDFNQIFIPELKSLISEVVAKTDGHLIKEYLEYIVTIANNGKRIRPYNTALSYTTYSDKEWTSVSDMLIGIELIHLMALIHDDVMDNSNTRHGSISMHEFINQSLNKEYTKDVHDIKHLSQSQAILVGDLIFAWAYKYFSKQNLDSQSWSIVNELTQEVILGQMMDIHNPVESETTAELIEKKMLLKTARYTFTRPFLLGAIYAGKDTEDINWLYEFGDSIGLLFQMQDDILDIKGNVGTIHKEPLEDIRNGTHTLISNYISNSKEIYVTEKWNQWFKNKSINNQDEICKLIQDSGGFDFALEYIKNKKALSLNAINKSGLDKEKTILFESLLEIISNRKF